MDNSLTPYTIRDLISRHCGRESAIKSAEIVEMITEKRSTESLEVAVRQAVVKLRKEGYPIASFVGGYYWAATAEEMQVFQKWLKGKAMHSLSLNSKITKRIIPVLAGQMGLPLGGTQSQSVTVVSALIDLPEKLHTDIQIFLNNRPEWDIDRLCEAAISLFLINQECRDV